MCTKLTQTFWKETDSQVTGYDVNKDSAEISFVTQILSFSFSERELTCCILSPVTRVTWAALCLICIFPPRRLRCVSGFHRGNAAAAHIPPPRRRCHDHRLPGGDPNEDAEDADPASRCFQSGHRWVRMFRGTRVLKWGNEVPTCCDGVQLQGEREGKGWCCCFPAPRQTGNCIFTKQIPKNKTAHNIDTGVLVTCMQVLLGTFPQKCTLKLKSVY